jgi:hypothetical protein
MPAIHAAVIAHSEESTSSVPPCSPLDAKQLTASTASKTYGLQASDTATD